MYKIITIADRAAQYTSTSAKPGLSILGAEARHSRRRIELARTYVKIMGSTRSCSAPIICCSCWDDWYLRAVAVVKTTGLLQAQGTEPKLAAAAFGLIGVTDGTTKRLK